jgi:O-antigen ligase
MAEIVWTRWLFYAVVGFPALLWLVLTRNNALRVLAVLFVLVFVQDIFSFRRTLVFLTVGPSVLITYGALVGLFLQRGRFPSLGMTGFLWLGFMLFAVTGALVGSLGTGLALFNLRTLQESYVEGLFFFLVGVMAFERDEEFRSFWLLFVVVIVGGVAVFHLLALASGWRPPVEYAKEVGVFFGGVFYNPNSLGHFYAMTMPIGIVLALRGGLRSVERLAVLGVLAVATVSLILTGSRGGVLLTPIMIFLVLALAGIRPGYLVGAGLAMAFAGAAAFGILVSLFPGAFGAVLDQWGEEGLRSGRLETAEQYIAMIVRHPLGVGLDPLNVVIASQHSAHQLSSAHNIYLDFALKMGPLGLLCFLALVAPIVLRAVRALRGTTNPVQRLSLLSLVSILGGFLAASLIEPLYSNGEKMNHFFWLMLGIAFTTGGRVSFELRQARRAAVRRPASSWAPVLDRVS